MTMKIPQLPGGQYIFNPATGAVKAIGQDIYQLLGTHASGDVEELAQVVSWVFTALELRSNYLAQIPWTWRVNGDDLDDLAALPFLVEATDSGATLPEQLARVDYAIQTGGVAYFHKLRRGSRFIGWQWLDPETVSADSQSVGARGYTRYFRDANSRRETIRRDDLLIFQRRGQRELDPASPAGVATKLAAEILYGVDLTLSALYKSNAVPPLLISVPFETSEESKKEIKRRWTAILNPRRLFSAEQRVIPVNQSPSGQETKISQLMLEPKSAELTPTMDNRIHAICAAHGVPFALVWGDSAYRASVDQDARQLVETMAARLKWMAQAINQDADMRVANFELVIQEDQHPVMRRDMTAPAVAYAQLVANRFTPQAAAILAGIDIDDLPDDIEPFVAPAPAPAPFQGTQAIDAEAAQFKRWLVKRIKAGQDANPTAFKAAHLSDKDKRLILLEVRDELGEAASADDAPFPRYDHESQPAYP